MLQRDEDYRSSSRGIRSRSRSRSPRRHRRRSGDRNTPVLTLSITCYPALVRMQLGCASDSKCAQAEGGLEVGPSCATESSAGAQARGRRRPDAAARRHARHRAIARGTTGGPTGGQGSGLRMTAAAHRERRSGESTCGIITVHYVNMHAGSAGLGPRLWLPHRLFLLQCSCAP